MAGNEKGGVLTKKMISLMAVVLFVAAAAACVMPSASAEDGVVNTYADIKADSYVVGTGSTIEYMIYADGGDEPVKFAAKIVDENGYTVGSVRAIPEPPATATPTTVNLEGTKLRLTAPSEAGIYTLSVTFTFKFDDETVTVTKTAPVRVVVPITLSAVVDNTNGGTIIDMEVWFEVDGVKIAGSEKYINIQAGRTERVEYKWAVEGLSGGAHTVMLVGHVGPTEQSAHGLNVPMTFYVGQNSHTLIEALMVIFFIVMLIALVIVYRKPVKNIGKPKGRR